MRQRLARHARESWDSYQRCLAGYDPSKHKPGSDEELRHRIAVNVLNGAKDRQDFEDALARALDRHFPEIERRLNAFMKLFPTQIMVITDTMTIFENEQLMTRMAETIRSLERMRGSATLPE